MDSKLFFLWTKWTANASLWFII